MAGGIPIVSTAIGCRGIEVVDKQHLLIANTENDFSRSVIELLRNSQRAQMLAENALALARDKYTWEKIVNEIEPKLLKLVSQANK